ncbi:MAG: LptF/LptG family permease [Treponema sp.]|nr:LptF/LptG family permease [Treponema sp.]
MKLIGYMLKKFFGIFLGSLMFFVLILMLTDLFINLWNYISKNVGAVQVGRIMLYYIPKTVSFSVPIAVLFATAYMLSDFYAKNELLAIFASGISLLKFTVPLLFVAVGMSVALFFFEDKVVVPTYSVKNKLQNQALSKEKSLNNDKIVIMSEGGNIIYKADYFDNRLERLYTLYVLFRNEDKSFSSLLYAESALWSEDHWELSDAVEYKFTDGGFKSIPVERELMERLSEPPEIFRNNTVSVEEVSTREAREYIEHLEKAGLPCGEEKSVYYKKFSFPFVVFIVVFLAVGLSGKTRKNVLIISLALSIGAVVLFYVTQMITMLMAKFGTIPPMAGAWFPVLMFTVLSVILLKYAKT